MEWRPLLALNHADLDGFDVDAEFLQPFDRRFHNVSFAVHFEANNADFISDFRLPDIRDHFESMTQLPQERALN